MALCPRPLPYEKTTEEKICQHVKDLKKKYRGEIKIRHRPTQSDATSGVSSANSNISKAMTAKAPSRRKMLTTIINNSECFERLLNRCIIGRIVYYFNPASKAKRNRRAPDCFGFESSVCSVSDDTAVPAPKRPRTTNLVIETIIQEEASQPPVVETSFDLPIVSPLAPPPVGTWSPENYEYEDYALEISMSLFDAENQV